MPLKKHFYLLLAICLVQLANTTVAQNNTTKYIAYVNDSLSNDLSTILTKQSIPYEKLSAKKTLTIGAQSYYLSTVVYDSLANNITLYMYNNLVVHIMGSIDTSSTAIGVQPQYLEWDNFNTLIQKRLTNYDNTGYPFATVQLHNSTLTNDTLTTTLRINKGKKNYIDSILISPANVLNYNLLTSILHLRKRTIYNQSTINEVQKRINKLGFIQLKNAPVVEYISPTISLLKLDIQTIKNNEAEALIGFLPDNVTGKILFTGYANFKLNNALKYAEQFILRWKHTQPQVQELTTQAMVPHIAGTPLGANASLQIYKRDSTFLNSQYSTAASYRFTYTNYVQVYYQHKANSALSKNITAQNFLPNTQTNLYGLKLAVDETNYSLNPIKGIVAELSIASGLRTINKTKNSFSQLEGYISMYKPLINKFVVHQKFAVNTLLADTLYTHELFRTGGVKSVRGFNDESLFGSSLLQSTTELRYILGKNANVFALYDLVYIENKSTQAYATNNGLLVHQLLQATGVGLNIDTKTGIFTLIYALGKQNNNNFDLRTSKIHVGFNVLF